MAFLFEKGQGEPIVEAETQEPKIGEKRARLLHNIPGGKPVLEVQKWNGKKWVFSHYEIYWPSKKYGDWFKLK